MPAPLEAPPLSLESAPFATRAELLAWLTERGVTHLARLNLEAVAPFLEREFWPDLARFGARLRLIEFASVDALADSAKWLPAPLLRERLPACVRQFLQSSNDEAALARSELSARLVAPTEPKAQALYTALCKLRAAVPATVAPRPLALLKRQALAFERKLPGFRRSDELLYEPITPVPGGFIRPETKLRFVNGSITASCSCGASACVHLLATLDSALEWLRQPSAGQFLEALDEIMRPAWERTLHALAQAFDAKPSDQVEVHWYVQVEDTGIRVTPYLQKPGKTPRRTSIPKARLLREHGSQLSAQDRMILALLPAESDYATRPLLDALLGHPRVVRADAPELHLEIERVPLGIIAEARTQTVRVTLGIEGTALSDALLERVRYAQADEVLFLWDGRTLSLLDVKPELRSLLNVLTRETAIFPRESHAALIVALSQWAERVPVSMPRSVLGEALPPLALPVLRLLAQMSGTVEVELRIRAQPDGSANSPGTGIKDVHVRRGDKAFHVIRDFEREIQVADRIEQLLKLDSVRSDNGPYSYELASVHAAFALLAAAESQSPAPELEWIGTPLRCVANVSVSALKVSVDQKREWFGALGGLSVAGERVELARLLDAVRRRERYVRVTAYTYVELNQQLQEHLARLADFTRSARRGLELPPSASLTLLELERAGAAVDAPKNFREFGARMAQAATWEPELPSGLNAQLRSYQAAGVRWLLRLAQLGAGGVLADDMGLGKTLQALTVLVARQGLGPALVLAPTSVTFNWQEEASRFAPSLRVRIYADAADRDAAIADLTSGSVLVVSYNLFVRDVRRFAGQHFATAIFDEAQQLKNAQTQRFRAARLIQADFKCALSGTPFENHLGELWAIFAAVFPPLLGSWESFRDSYATPIEKVLDPAAGPALARLIQPFLLRRTKSQVETELPPRTEVQVRVVLSSAEWQLYEDARLAVLSDLKTRKSKLKEQERRVEILAALTRLRLLACHPQLYDAHSHLPSSKLARLLELVQELVESGQRALIFSQFTTHLAFVRELLEAHGMAYVYLDGQTPQAERRERVATFQAGDAPFFLISLKAGGFGLNLTAASNVILLDPWWNPAVEEQAGDRVHRLGQTRPVTIYRLITLGTIEEQMLTLHAQKRALISDILTGNEHAASITTQQLFELLSNPAH